MNIESHPLLDAATFELALPRPLGELPSPEWLVALLKRDAPAPFRPDEGLKLAVRDLLRHGGFKPAGRSKPASEYLIAAADAGTLGSINAVVDACNAASLHGGLPISVVDRDRTVGELAIRIAPPGTTYVFNASGQTLDLGGLVALWDAEGPCANAVKDSQRTKTDGGTRRAAVVVWGTTAAPGRAAAVAAWYRELLARVGATV